MKALLIIGGGIAAYKSLDLIRRLRERGIAVRVVMTDAAQKFITPLSAGALAGEHPYTDLFDAKLELDVGHIRLARDAEHRDRRAGHRRPDGEDGAAATPTISPRRCCSPPTGRSCLRRR